MKATITEELTPEQADLLAGAGKPKAKPTPPTGKPHPLTAIRSAGVPLCAWECSDPALTIAAGLRALNGRRDETPVIQWDVVRGLVGVNPAGEQACQDMEADPISTGNPVECLTLIAQKAPKGSLIYLHNTHRIFGEPSPTQSLPFTQALWNLRDKFKGEGSTLILLCPAMTLPAELKNDVVIVSEPLPDVDELGRIVDSIQADAKLEPFPDRAKIIDALLGLSAFGAEQSLALSIRKTGLDREELWERKRKMVEQTPGLSVWRGGERFDDIGGCDNVKGFMRSVINGNRSPLAIILLEELEKSLGNVGGDLSGVSADYLGVLLEFMQNRQASGVIFVGPPGCISGETPLTIRRGKRNSGRVYTAAQLFRLFNGGRNRSRTWDKRIPSQILSLDGKTQTIRYRQIEDVIFSGRKSTFTVSVSGSEPFRATADHRFLTPSGYVELGKLTAGSEVIVRGEPNPRGRQWKKREYKQMRAKYHPNAVASLVRWSSNPNGKRYNRHPVHRMILEASMNGLEFSEFVRVVNSDPVRAAQLTYLLAECIVHHKDENPRNNSADNLQAMSKEDHDRLHGKNNVVSFGTFNPSISTIQKIEYYGEEDTYDLTMIEPDPNFLVNGVVIHNCAKSMIAKSLGAEGNIPTINMDLGGMKGSLVGQSEQRIREGLKVADAVGQGRLLFVATMNSYATIPPELKRRFNLSTFMFDLPVKAEREKIWALNRRKFSLDESRNGAPFSDEGWTGAEIRQCCDVADRIRCTLDEASRFIVPVSRSAADTIETLRKQASGKFISASYPGVYRFDKAATSAPSTGRKIGGE